MKDATMTFGTTTGGVRILLRAEGLALLMTATSLFWHLGGDWRVFTFLFLVPDISFAGYLAGPRIGALAYNAMHSTIAPLALASAAVASDQRLVLAIALIWLAHIGFDRALGYGLKHARGFGLTHLGAIGRSAKEA